MVVANKPNRIRRAAVLGEPALLILDTMRDWPNISLRGLLAAIIGILLKLLDMVNLYQACSPFLSAVPGAVLRGQGWNLSSKVLGKVGIIPALSGNTLNLWVFWSRQPVVVGRCNKTTGVIPCVQRLIEIRQKCSWAS